MVICGISAFFFWFVTTRAHMIAMSCIFSGLATAGWNALDVLSMELYPTHLRLAVVCLAVQSAIVVCICMARTPC